MFYVYIYAYRIYYTIIKRFKEKVYHPSPTPTTHGPNNTKLSGMKSEIHKRVKGTPNEKTLPATSRSIKTLKESKVKPKSEEIKQG